MRILWLSVTIGPPKSNFFWQLSLSFSGCNRDTIYYCRWGRMVLLYWLYISMYVHMEWKYICTLCTFWIILNIGDMYIAVRLIVYTRFTFVNPAHCQSAFWVSRLHKNSMKCLNRSSQHHCTIPVASNVLVRSMQYYHPSFTFLRYRIINSR